MVRIGYCHDLGFSIGGGHYVSIELRLWRAANAATASFSAGSLVGECWGWDVQSGKPNWDAEPKVHGRYHRLGENAL